MKVMTAYPEFTDFENMLVKRMAVFITRRYGLSFQDKEDIEQELALCILEQRANYDPDHTSGCSYEAFITKYIVKNHLKILRDIRPDIRIDDDDEKIDTSLSAYQPGGISREPVESLVITGMLAETAYNQLTLEQKILFEQLADGKTILEIAQEEGLPYNTVYYRFLRIKEIFRKHGFNLSTK